MDAAIAATQLAAWSDLEYNILNDGSSVVSEDSEDVLLSAGDDETNDNMSDLSPVNSSGARTSAKDEMSDNSEEESDSDNRIASSDPVTQSTFKGRNLQVWASTCSPLYQTHQRRTIGKCERHQK